MFRIILALVLLVGIGWWWRSPSLDELDLDTPVVGNPDGDVTMVEFFDYRCRFSKQVLPTVRKLLERDGDIRLVLKEFPILGPDSVVTARAALAAWKLDPAKYMGLHVALMSVRGVLDKAKVLIVAAKIGYDTDAVAEGMSAAWIDAAIDRNKTLASRLGINGTPAFIIGDVLIPGTADLGTLERAIGKARGG